LPVNRNTLLIHLTLTRAERRVIHTTDQTKQQIAEASTIEDKVKAVNKVLQDGEPHNVSIDAYLGYTGYKPQFIVDAMNIGRATLSGG